MKHRVLLSALLLLAPYGALAAQERPAAAFQPGARVRITAPGLQPEQLTGTVVSVDSEWVHVASRDPEAQTWMRLEFVDAVEVSRGTNRRYRTWKGSSWGAFLGFGMGVISGALASKNLPTTIEQSAALGGIGVGLIGGGIGAAIGALIPARERWQPYRMTQVPAPAATGTGAPPR
ncbi:MAG TPA: hypothetical protein VHG28_22495 [Longimicrobiaceae bacterium]|nr:hypothetical protein [Longimicrobiaceae bacterium]